MQNENLELFFLDLEDAEELPMQESPWYLAIGGKGVMFIL